MQYSTGTGESAPTCGYETSVRERGIEDRELLVSRMNFHELQHVVARNRASIFKGRYENFQHTKKERLSGGVEGCGFRGRF